MNKAAISVRSSHHRDAKCKASDRQVAQKLQQPSYKVKLFTLILSLGNTPSLVWHIHFFCQQMTMPQDPSGEYWSWRITLVTSYRSCRDCIPISKWRPAFLLFADPNRTPTLETWTQTARSSASSAGCVVSVSDWGGEGCLPVTLTSITVQHIGRSRMKDWFKQFHLCCLCSSLQPALFSSRLRIHTCFYIVHLRNTSLL